MHDGGLGGGRKGVGKRAFLDFLRDPLVEVRGSRRSRVALMVANLNDPGVPALIWRFVQKAGDFKKAQRGDRGGAVPAGDEGDDYTPEFSGRKRGTRPGEFDYITYHGMIVDELKRDRESRRVPGEHVSRDRLVDLFVWNGERRTEVYEVKTSCDRQSLYTGIGQLITHARDATARRILVLPKGSKLPADCAAALARERIHVRHFEIVGSGLGARVALGPT